MLPLTLISLLFLKNKFLHSEELYEEEINTYIKSNYSNSNFKNTLFKMIDERNLKDSDVYNKVHIDRRLFTKIRNDKKYHPSKETIILLGLSLYFLIKSSASQIYHSFLFSQS